MTKQYSTKQSVLDEVQNILGRSLRDVMLDDVIYNNVQNYEN